MVVKQSGSYEQVSYAIQDTPAMVAQRYGRFLPHDKAALAARRNSESGEEILRARLTVRLLMKL
jgi:hypothetical protein